MKSEKTEYEKLAEKKVTSDEVFHGKLLHVFNDTVILPDGKRTGRDLIRHLGAVAVVPVDEDGNVYFERQFRYPVDCVITEIPAGKLDSPDEDRLSAAKRELREETGLTADNWVELGTYLPTPAYSDEVITLYAALNLHQRECERDDDEFIDVMKKPLGELVSDVLAGKIPDGKTQTALLKVYLMQKELGIKP